MVGLLWLDAYFGRKHMLKRSHSFAVALCTVLFICSAVFIAHAQQKQVATYWQVVFRASGAEDAKRKAWKKIRNRYGTYGAAYPDSRNRVVNQMGEYRYVELSAKRTKHGVWLVFAGTWQTKKQRADWIRNKRQYKAAADRWYRDWSKKNKHRLPK